MIRIKKITIPSVVLYTLKIKIKLYQYNPAKNQSIWLNSVQIV